jgi:hypothetical protein
MLTSINSFLEANLLIAILVINAMLIYNKSILKSDGHKVYWAWGWWKDYQIVKTVPKYKNLKRLLQACLFYLVGILVLGVLTNIF